MVIISDHPTLTLISKNRNSRPSSIIRQHEKLATTVNHAVVVRPKLSTTVCLFGLDGIFPRREMGLLLLLLLGDSAGILLAQSSSDGTGLLCSEIQREVLLLGVEESQLVSLVGVDDGQDAGN